MQDVDINLHSMRSSGASVANLSPAVPAGRVQDVQGSEIDCVNCHTGNTIFSDSAGAVQYMVALRPAVA